jgi:hypothetical protein
VFARHARCQRQTLAHILQSLRLLNRLFHREISAATKQGVLRFHTPTLFNSSTAIPQTETRRLNHCFESLKLF